MLSMLFGLLVWCQMEDATTHCRLWDYSIAIFWQGYRFALYGYKLRWKTYLLYATILEYHLRVVYSTYYNENCLKYSSDVYSKMSGNSDMKTFQITFLCDIYEILIFFFVISTIRLLDSLQYCKCCWHIIGKDY